MGRHRKAIVTFLEMTGRPEAHHVPTPPGRLALMRAERPPVHFYRYLYDTVGRAHYWVNRKRMSDETLTEIIHNPSVEIYILYVDGAPAGFAELDFRRAPLAELIFLGLVPEFIGRGYGRFLLWNMLETAWEKPIDKLYVQTNTLDHPHALILYQKFGFRPYAQREVTIREVD